MLQLKDIMYHISNIMFLIISICCTQTNIDPLIDNKIIISSVLHPNLYLSESNNTLTFKDSCGIPMNTMVSYVKLKKNRNMYGIFFKNKSVCPDQNMTYLLLDKCKNTPYLFFVEHVNPNVVRFRIGDLYLAADFDPVSQCIFPRMKHLWHGDTSGDFYITCSESNSKNFRFNIHGRDQYSNSADHEKSDCHKIMYPNFNLGDDKNAFVPILIVPKTGVRGNDAQFIDMKNKKQGIDPKCKKLKNSLYGKMNQSEHREYGNDMELNKIFDCDLKEVINDNLSPRLHRLIIKKWRKSCDRSLKKKLQLMGKYYRHIIKRHDESDSYSNIIDDIEMLSQIMDDEEYCKDTKVLRNKAVRKLLDRFMKMQFKKKKAFEKKNHPSSSENVETSKSSKSEDTDDKGGLKEKKLGDTKQKLAKIAKIIKLRNKILSKMRR